MYVIHVRNVNEALPIGLALLRDNGIARPSRVGPVLEYPEPVATVYDRPRERVLWSQARDANPFFHFFEALWIIAGRDDVSFLKHFNSKIADYSDDGVKFHAPYGHRLRYTFGFDQINEAVAKLRDEPTTRQVVMSVWDPKRDWEKSKDIPCNDMVMLKIRDDKLLMTVCNRSNDVVWGAYGANVVQFSMLQEYIAARIGIKIGAYTQISDSFHVYTDLPFFQDWLESHRSGIYTANDPYVDNLVWPYDLFGGIDNTLEHVQFMSDLGAMFSVYNVLPIEMAWHTDTFAEVVDPLLRSYAAYKAHDKSAAIDYARACRATDWSEAAVNWLERRKFN